MEQNKVQTYLLYAVGEILLVVIGILIALQVNTWNEDRKNKNFEKEILQLIDQNLQKDSLLIATELDKTQLANRLTDSVLVRIDQKQYGDTLNYWTGKIISFERFKSQSSAFEVLKSKGIETISNKDLQVALISYYDVNLFNLYQSLNDVLYSFNTDWIPIIKSNFSDFRWTEYASPSNQQEFFGMPTTKVLFKIYQDNREGQERKMKTALNKITEIRTLIKKDLK